MGAAKKSWAKHLREKETRSSFVPNAAIYPLMKKSWPIKQYVTETINSSIQQSLSELQTDYIDVYKLHNAHSNILKNETVL